MSRTSTGRPGPSSSKGSGHATAWGDDQRKEVREPGEGEVTVLPLQPGGREVTGDLIDLSPGGFRMAHLQKSLEPGLVVQFHHASGEGRGRVIWNRIVGEKIETGFLVLDEK